MRSNLLKLYVKIRNLKDAIIRDESGQDLVEYALVLALIALAATVSMKTLATNIGTAFTSVGTKLTTYTS
jgi:pilus assembly protein Flp/PilA